MSSGTIDPAFYLPFALPVLWIVVASIAALVLYRTSSALVEQVSKKSGTQRTVRLVGSGAIAVVIFVLLWRSTPNVGGAPGDLRIGREQQARIADLTLEVNQAWVRLDLCLQMTSAAECREQLDDVRSASRQLAAGLPKALRPGDTRGD